MKELFGKIRENNMRIKLGSFEFEISGDALLWSLCIVGAVIMVVTMMVIKA
jgi:hypothetical protein